MREQIHKDSQSEKSLGGQTANGLQMLKLNIKQKLFTVYKGKGYTHTNNIKFRL